MIETAWGRPPDAVEPLEPKRFELAIVGFGFSGLATLAHLTTTERPISVAVIAADPSGLGLAYATRQPRHLLNVVSRRMGALAPGDFSAWLATEAGARAAARLGVAIPGPDAFAPRALFGAYLTALRAQVIERARAASMPLRWVDGRADHVRRDDDGWTIEVTGDGAAGAEPAGSTIRARTVVLATGHEQRPVSDAVTHLGSLALDRRPPRDSGEPAVLIGTGLTAVDALLSLRAGGFTGPVLAVSRSGLLPRAHAPGAGSMTISVAEAESLDRVSAVVRFLRTAAPPGSGPEGCDWRDRIDALRPHTTAIWQRLSMRQQRSVVRRWSPWWSVHRHRMAPENAAVVAAELAAGTLRVATVRSVVPGVAPDGTSEVALEPHHGSGRRLRAAAIVDCTGSQLDVARSEQPLLRRLVADGIVVTHHTRLGLVADADHRVADGLYALGSLLVGQRWESIAVPELRDQAAVVAGAVRAERGAPARA